jgi:hypothetical protein
MSGCSKTICKSAFNVTHPNREGHVHWESHSDLVGQKCQAQVCVSVTYVGATLAAQLAGLAEALGPRANTGKTEMAMIDGVQ